MKILKIFGIVVGIHLFALILIFANPGCSTTKPAPSPGDTASGSNASPIIAAPSAAPTASTASEPTSSAISFHPDTPAVAAPVNADPGVRFSPTRPGTPVAGALVPEPVADVTPAAPYTVKSGDNLWTIARKHNTTVAQLTAANRLSPNASLRPGQKLIIPAKQASVSNAKASTGSVPSPKASGAPATAASRAGTDVVKHVVKSGETLGAIARKYEVRQGELAVANNISDPARIRPGMELIIPGWKAPSGKSAKPASAASAPASDPLPAAFEPLPVQTEPATPPPVPVIRIDEGPAAPAPQL